MSKRKKSKKKGDSSGEQRLETLYAKILRTHDDETFIEFSHEAEILMRKAYSHIMRNPKYSIDADDVVQRVHFKILKLIQKSPLPVGGFSGQLFSITCNTIRDMLRANKTQKDHMLAFAGMKEASASTNEQHEPLEELLKVEKRVHVVETIMNLPPKYQNILLIRFYSDKRISFEEIARQLGLKNKQRAHDLNAQALTCLGKQLGTVK